MDESTQHPQIGRVRWTICAFLFVATSINYVDRQVIGILKPTLQQSIGMSEIQYGYIVDAFQLGYSAALLVAGRLIDRLGTRIGYVLIMAIWSLSAMGAALANSVFQFGIARFCLGVGESGNFPAALKTVAEWFPQKERSFATGLFNSGATVGSILAPLLVPWITFRYGWRASFLLTSLFSTAWIVLWFTRYRPPSDYKPLTEAERSYICEGAVQAKQPQIPWKNLICFRRTWAFAAGKFFTDPIWWFYLFWMPSYFSARFHVDLSHLALPLILVYGASSLGSVGGGWLPGLFTRLGFSANRARLSGMFLCACLVVPVVGITMTNSEWVAVALLGLAAAAHCGWSANLLTLPSDMFPANAVGSVVSIGTMAGTLSGMIFATCAGYLLEFTHSYSVMFVIASIAYLVAFAAITMLLPAITKVEPAA